MKKPSLKKVKEENIESIVICLAGIKNNEHGKQKTMPIVHVQ